MPASRYTNAAKKAAAANDPLRPKYLRTSSQTEKHFAYQAEFPAGIVFHGDKSNGRGRAIGEVCRSDSIGPGRAPGVAKGNNSPKRLDALIQ